MKLYISGDNPEEFQYETVKNIKDSELVLILPGGLGTFADLFTAIKLKKRTILYNQDMYYVSVIKNLYSAYTEGRIEGAPSDYLEIESDKKEIIRKLEEEKNDKINNGKTSKLL